MRGGGRRRPAAGLGLAGLLPGPLSLGAAGAAPPRGVGPDDAAAYAGAAAEGFRCLEDPALPLPLSAVNDDYCDCPDGSDEPGTAACAGLAEGRGRLFFCANEGSRPAFIYSSRVGDGVCDCCDGSDEWRPDAPGACADSCAEEGRGFREAEDQRLETWALGRQRQRELLQAAEQSAPRQREEAARLRAGLPALEAERDARRQAAADAGRQAASARGPRRRGFLASTTASPAEQAMQRAQEELAEATRNLEQCRARLRETDAALHPGLEGPRLALAALKGDCLRRREGEEIFRLCFFREALQDEADSDGVSLGTWQGWDFAGPAPAARFAGGAACWDAEVEQDPDENADQNFFAGSARRELRATFACGRVAEIQAVRVRGCLYEATVLHPGACTGAQADADPELGAGLEELLEAVRKEAPDWRAVNERSRAELPKLERREARRRKLFDSAEAALGEEPEQPGGEEKKVSEYAKWMDGGSAAPAGAATTTEGLPETPEEAAHREAEAAAAAAGDAVMEAKHRLRGLEAAADPRLEGGARALASLVDACLPLRAGASAYEVCFFRNASQDTESEKGLSLGRWIGWAFAPGAALPSGQFARGSPCGPGGRRSLEVSFVCGGEAELRGVSEPEMCSYVAEVVHPAACNASEPLVRRVQPARMPHEEL